jgi:hypothetical protein
MGERVEKNCFRCAPRRKQTGEGVVTCFDAFWRVVPLCGVLEAALCYCLHTVSQQSAFCYFTAVLYRSALYRFCY